MTSDIFKGTKVDMVKCLLVTFFLSCIVGWLYETVLEVCIYKTGFSNRGFLFGPWLPVYGFGVLAFLPGFLWISDKHINKAIKIALTAVFCALVATIIELATSYILELFTGGWLWDYSSRYTYQFQGRIALNTSFRFGVGGALLLYSFIPFASWIHKRSWLEDILCCGVALMVIDFCITLLT